MTKEDAAYLQKKAWDVYQKYARFLEAPAKNAKEPASGGGTPAPKAPGAE